MVFTYELKGDEVILKWEEPNNNGAEITLYTVYHGSLTDEQWKKIEVSSRNYAFKVEMGKKYRVLVTASNKYGESSKKGMIQQVDVLEGGLIKLTFIRLCAPDNNSRAFFSSVY